MPARVRAGLQALLLVALVAAGLWAHGAMAESGRMFLPLAGGVFLVAGWIAGSLRWPGPLGVRTPWTLADPYVWERTHRFAGRLLAGGGLLLLVAAALDRAPQDRVGGVALLAVTSIVAIVAKSYVYWLRQKHPEI